MWEKKTALFHTLSTEGAASGVRITGRMASGEGVTLLVVPSAVERQAHGRSINRTVGQKIQQNRMLLQPCRFPTSQLLCHRPGPYSVRPGGPNSRNYAAKCRGGTTAGPAAGCGVVPVSAGCEWASQARQPPPRTKRQPERPLQAGPWPADGRAARAAPQGARVRQACREPPLLPFNTPEE